MSDCLAQEIAFNERVHDFEVAANAADDIRWEEEGIGFAAAVLGALATAVTTGTPVGATPGLISTWKDIVGDYKEVGASDAASQAVEAAFDALQKCREANTQDEEHIYSDGNRFDDFVVIPFEEPSPSAGPDPEDDEIVIFEEDENGEIVIFIEDDDTDEDEIIILDE